jgi:hypothetical protein
VISVAASGQVRLCVLYGDSPAARSARAARRLPPRYQDAFRVAPRSFGELRRSCKQAKIPRDRRLRRFLRTVRAILRRWEGVPRHEYGKTAVPPLCDAASRACGQTPLKPGDSHLREQAGAEGTIPQPVQITPMLPQPKPAARPETYSVVVSNVRVQELLFALARDASLQRRHRSDITGTVTLNAIDQTLPQLLTRIARQVDMRYEIDGQNLVVMRDTPFLRVVPHRLRQWRAIAQHRHVSTQVTARLAASRRAARTTPPRPSTSARRTSSGNRSCEHQGDPARDRQGAAGRGARRAARPPRRRRPATHSGAPATPAAPQRRGRRHLPRGRVGDRQPRDRHPLHARHLAQHEKVQEFLDSVMAEREAPGADRGHGRRGAARTTVPARHRLAAPALGPRRGCPRSARRSGDRARPRPTPRHQRERRSCSAASRSLNFTSRSSSSSPSATCACSPARSSRAEQPDRGPAGHARQSSTSPSRRDSVTGSGGSTLTDLHHHAELGAGRLHDERVPQISEPTRWC